MTSLKFNVNYFAIMFYFVNHKTISDREKGGLNNTKYIIFCASYKSVQSSIQNSFVGTNVCM